MILAGDIGGTKVELALYDGPPNKTKPAFAKRYPSRDFSGLEVIVADFLKTHPCGGVEGASFGIAGAVKDGVVHTTNLPWVVTEKKLSDTVGGAPASLLNDLEANAWGIGVLEEDEIETIHPGEGLEGNRALISAGTGLGIAGLYWDEDRGEHLPFASEGGHASFAPQEEIDLELYHHLKDKYKGTVSWERVLCGKALVDIYHFLVARAGKESPRWLEEEMMEGDAAAAVSKAGQQNKDDFCVEALELFTRYYGAQAGNTALNFLALGGLYIGGGIAPKMLDQLRDRTFLDAYLNKGRLRPTVESIPVRVILNPKTALLGAAVHAGRQCRK
ncbi:MAG: glucokinase [Verrucomicrobiota bacterium]